MTELVNHNLRCIAYDRRGCGRSSQPGGSYDYDVYQNLPRIWGPALATVLIAIVWISVVIGSERDVRHFGRRSQMVIATRRFSRLADSVHLFPQLASRRDMATHPRQLARMDEN